MYAEVIAKGHVFLDGNKRTALLSMLGFLNENGYSTSADPIGLAEMIVRLVESELDYRQFAIWLEPKLLVAPDEP